MKKKVFSFLMTLILLVGIGFTQNVYAASNWQQTSQGWSYSENGIAKTGWILDGDNWYYLNQSGNMMTGWIITNGTWYYMLEDGSLDNSKTTTTVPNEIQLTYNIVKPFAGGLNIKYAGKGFVNDKDGFCTYGLKDKWLIAFSSEDNYGNKADYYFYDPYNCKVYELYSDLTIHYLGQGNMTNDVSEEQAIENVRKHLIDNKIDIPNLLFGAVDDRNNTYLVFCYSKNVDHVNTAESYYVDKTTGNVINANK